MMLNVDARNPHAVTAFSALPQGSLAWVEHGHWPPLLRTSRSRLTIEGRQRAGDLQHLQEKRCFWG